MKIDSNAINVFFSSDLHFNHFNIIKYCNRPFEYVENMNYELTKNWNSVVKQDDVGFILGDFAFVKNDIKKLAEFVYGLNGTKHLVLGNHDYHIMKDKQSFRDAGFCSVNDYLDITILDEEIDEGRQRLFLSHYPMVTWAGASKGSWNLFGHIHSPNNNFPLFLGQSPKSLDVGVDANNYHPLSFTDVKTIITKQSLQSMRKQ